MGIGVTWGVLWAMIGVALVLVMCAFDPGSVDAGEGPVTVGSVLGFAGLVSGAAFGTLLTIAERRRNLRELSLWRAGLWGALGAAVIPLLTAADNSMVIITCPLGFLFATASILVARRADLRDVGRAPIRVPAPR